jgi:hypothetical protein
MLYALSTQVRGTTCSPYSCFDPETKAIRIPLVNGDLVKGTEEAINSLIWLAVASNGWHVVGQHREQHRRSQCEHWLINLDVPLLIMEVSSPAPSRACWPNSLSISFRLPPIVCRRPCGKRNSRRPNRRKVLRDDNQNVSHPDKNAVPQHRPR